MNLQLLCSAFLRGRAAPRLALKPNDHPRGSQNTPKIKFVWAVAHTNFTITRDCCKRLDQGIQANIELTERK